MTTPATLPLASLTVSYKWNAVSDISQPFPMLILLTGMVTFRLYFQSLFMYFFFILNLACIFTIPPKNPWCKLVHWGFLRCVSILQLNWCSNGFPKNNSNLCNKVFTPMWFKDIYFFLYIHPDWPCRSTKALKFCLKIVLPFSFLSFD